MASSNRFAILSDNSDNNKNIKQSNVDIVPNIKITLDTNIDQIDTRDNSDVKITDGSFNTKRSNKHKPLRKNINDFTKTDSSDADIKIEIQIESDEEIDSGVDELLGVMMNLPVKLESSFWGNETDLNKEFTSLTEFSPKFVDFLVKHGAYRLDTIFAAMEYTPGVVLSPTRSSLLEFCLFSISKMNINLKRWDYLILDKIFKRYKGPIMFSAIIGGRDISTCAINNFGDSGLELTEETSKTFNYFIPILHYLQRNNILVFDYPHIHGNMSFGIKPVEGHTYKFFVDKKWVDRYGVCYYNVFRRENTKVNSSINYNKFLAALSYIKGAMYHKTNK